jgi:hypothetical protein
VVIFCVTVFTSAFLLFQVQPVIGKFILPWFGSTPGVWSTCLLFFQLLLLAGYGYSHVIVTHLTVKRQAIVHCCLLGLALVALPITPDASFKPIDADLPVLRILVVLAVTVGIPYLLLSASGPLLQSWFARLLPDRSPYRLYALSNAGSLLGLLSYPFVFERFLPLQQQSVLWSLGYVFFALACGACAWLLGKQNADGNVSLPDAAGQDGQNVQPEARKIFSWLGFSACGSALLLATTNQMSIDTAVVPFLWVLPLCLYLLSFILCFDSERWYVRPLYFAALPFVLINIVRVLYDDLGTGLVEQIVSFSLTLFVCCMCMHGELARLKPDPKYLTLFYLMVAVGGAAGGLFVAVVSPAVFSGFYEYSILLVICAGAVGFMAVQQATSMLSAVFWRSLSGVFGVVGVAAILVGIWLGLTTDHGLGRSSTTVALFETWHNQLFVVVWLGIGLVLVTAEIYRRKTQAPSHQWLSFKYLVVLATRGTVVIGIFVFASVLVWVSREDERRQVFRDRNFYGVLAIREYDKDSSSHLWGLRHGHISHGEQLKKHPSWPTSYFGPRSAIGLAIQEHPRRGDTARQFRIGVVGLGVGTIAAYANTDINPDASRNDYVKPRESTEPDYLRFYEINPMVTQWAEHKFSFLSDARNRGADLKIWEGDARIVMERQLAEGNAQRFDVLAIDAFSSDAIPMHLLTVEAFATYLRHLQDDGILTLHLSNRFLNVKPVVRRIADELNLRVVYIKNRSSSRSVSSSSWMIVTSNEEFLDNEKLNRDQRKLPDSGPLWTDDFSSLFEVIKSLD